MIWLVQACESKAVAIAYDDFRASNRAEQKFICPVCLTSTLQLKKKQLQETKINYRKKQANIKYYNYKNKTITRDKNILQQRTSKY